MFKMTPSTSSVSAAPGRCQSLHPEAQLAIIRDIYYWNLSVLLMGSTANDAFIGLSQNTTTKQWLWRDGIPLAGNDTYPRYYLWQSGQPSGDGPVGTIRISNTIDTGMNDALTTAVTYSICEVQGRKCFCRVCGWNWAISYISGELQYELHAWHVHEWDILSNMSRRNFLHKLWSFFVYFMSRGIILQRKSL